MLPPCGSSPAEQWVAEGKRASARDLIYRLAQLKHAGSITILAAEQADRHDLGSFGVAKVMQPPEPFHFGRVVASIVNEGDLRCLAYFGGGSAPLMTEDLLAEAFDRIANANGATAVVNNYHSSDWVVLNQAKSMVGLEERFPQDNPIGWILDQEAGFHVHALQPSASTRADIDTPTDLLMFHGHPSLGGELQAFLNREPRQGFRTIDQVREVLRTPASTLTLIGRTSSHLWNTLEKKTQVWTRCFVEERGMVASGRLASGEVKSLIGEILDAWGPIRFIEGLSTMSDAVLWDTRVWMAVQGDWPSTADRFAADLGWADQVENEALKALAEALQEATIPIVAGGYGVVSGGLYALLESLEID